MAYPRRGREHPFPTCCSTGPLERTRCEVPLPRRQDLDQYHVEPSLIAERCGVAHEFMLEPGDLLLANNRKVMHARQDYEDYPELDRRRHLLRLWMATTDEMKTKTFQAPSDRFS